MPETTLQNLLEKYHDKIAELIHLYEYRFNRYGLEYSLVLCYQREGEDLSDIGSLVRLTDSYMMLEKRYYCVVYEGTNLDQAMKAAHHIILHFKREHGSNEIFVSAVSAREKMDDEILEFELTPKEELNTKKIIYHLFYRLEETINAKENEASLTQ